MWGKYIFLPPLSVLPSYQDQCLCWQIDSESSNQRNNFFKPWPTVTSHPQMLIPECHFQLNCLLKQVKLFCETELCSHLCTSLEYTAIKTYSTVYFLQILISKNHSPEERKKQHFCAYEVWGRKIRQIYSNTYCWNTRSQVRTPVYILLIYIYTKHDSCCLWQNVQRWKRNWLFF